MTQDQTPEGEINDRSGWIGPFVARGDQRPAEMPAEEALPPLHLSREGKVAVDRSASQGTGGQLEHDPTGEADLLGRMMGDAVRVPSPVEDVTPHADPPDASESAALSNESEPVSPSASSWDDEPWATAPVSDDPGGDPLSGILDGEFLLDLPSVALPAEGLEPRDSSSSESLDDTQQQDAPDWQQWLHDNRAAGGHHFPPLEDRERPNQATVSEMGGDLSGLEHYDWIDDPEESTEDEPGSDEPSGVQSESARPESPAEQGDYGWMDLSGAIGDLDDVDADSDFDLDVGPVADRDNDPISDPQAAGTTVDVGLDASEVEAVAGRLERIARSLREHGLTGPLADRDPLGALIAGYLLGATSRGDDGGSR